MTTIDIMMKNKAGALSKLLAKPGPKPCPPLPWLQPTVFNTLNFVVSNEVECLDKKVWLVELLLSNKPGHEDYLHLSVVDNQTLQGASGCSAINMELVAGHINMHERTTKKNQ
jgi:hypothetical protein